MKNYPGSISDIKIFEADLELHQQRTVKDNDDKDMQDSYFMSGDCSSYWAVLMDKGYQGSNEMFHVVKP